MNENGIYESTEQRKLSTAGLAGHIGMAMLFHGLDGPWTQKCIDDLIEHIQSYPQWREDAAVDQPLHYFSSDGVEVVIDIKITVKD